MWPRFGFKLLCLKARHLNIRNTCVLLFAKRLLSPSIIGNLVLHSLNSKDLPQRSNPDLVFCGNCVGDDYIVNGKVMFT